MCRNTGAAFSPSRHSPCGSTSPGNQPSSCLWDKPPMACRCRCSSWPATAMKRRCFDWRPRSRPSDRGLIEGPHWPEVRKHFSFPLPLGEGENAMVSRLRKESFSRLCVLHDDGADGTVLCCIQNLLDRIPLRIDRFRLPLLIEYKDLWGNRFAHGIADTHIMINRDSDLSRHDAPLIPGHWQRLERTEGNTRLVSQLLRCQLQ